MSNDASPLPRYRLGLEIAHGGLGRVVEAFDPELKRTVAVKLVHEGLPAELRDRFLREAELTARLEHPNIVPVHDLVRGEGGEPMLAMKRIQGRDLSALIKDLAKGGGRAWSRPRLLAMFQSICQGVAFAHARGVIHRDLKPSNVMLGEFGEVLIVDWGLAKEVGAREGGVEHDTRLAIATTGATDATMVPVHRDKSASLTLDGDVIGTPAYMPPEQADGRMNEVDERSDVYALGAILYEILTLRPPAEGDSVAEILSHAKSGVNVPPSQRLRTRDAAAPGIPPELDAIAMKALATRREDRFQTARELHDQVQLFLEGVKERERREREARDRIEGGRKWLARYRELRGEISSLEKVVKELGAAIKPHQPLEEKKPLWDTESRLRASRDERIDAFSRASADFGQALSVDPGNVDALDGKCELFLDRFLDAEARRDREEMRLDRNTLAQYDREGKYRAKIDAPGTLTLRTFSFPCDCLRPVRRADRKVEIAETCTIPWREGRPRPDLPLVDRDRPVPELTVRWGHTPACVRSEVTGVEVSIAKYEERDRRLVLGAEKALGRTPLVGVEVSRGSWLCTLRGDGLLPVRLPVRIDRDGTWVQDVNLYRPGDVPEGFCGVAGGPFTFGGTWAGGLEEQAVVTADVFVAQFPVTCGEYLEFLNDLFARERADEARARQPREGERRLWTEESGRLRLPAPSPDSKLAWDPRWPVLAISWFDALAYCAWRSSRDGVVYRLPHEEEYEKSCRGVDGRVYAFGDEHDGSYAHCSLSVAGKITPMPVGHMPGDESPYGIRDLSGGSQSWCLNAPEVPGRDWRCLRGGGWNHSPEYGRAGTRRGDPPAGTNRSVGLRLAVSPVTPYSSSSGVQ